MCWGFYWDSEERKCPVSAGSLRRKWLHSRSAYTHRLEEDLDGDLSIGEEIIGGDGRLRQGDVLWRRCEVGKMVVYDRRVVSAAPVGAKEYLTTSSRYGGKKRCVRVFR